MATGAAPTWMDLYKEYTSQDWFKNQQKDYGGQIDRRWNADEGTRAAKQAIDDLYLQRLNEYNKANGTNFEADKSMLGADAQPNDWNRTQNKQGWLQQNGINPDTLLAAGALGLGGYALMNGGLGSFLGSATTSTTSPNAIFTGLGADGVMTNAEAMSYGLTGGGVSAPSGLLGGLGSAAGAVGSALSGNKGLGLLAGAALGAAADKDTTTSAQKDPWGPAQGYLKDNLAQNAAMQQYYQQNPFSQEQKAAYQGLLNTNANGLANAGNYAQIANNFMQSNRGQMPTMPGLLTGQTAAPVNWAAYSNIGKKA